MQKGMIGDKALAKLKEIESILQNRSKEYSCCQITSTLSKDNDSWKIAIAEISFLRDENLGDSSHEYDDLKLIKETVDVKRGKETINEIFKEGKLRLKNNEIKFGGEFKDSEYWNSTESPSSIGFPCNMFYVEIAPQFRGSPNYEPLLKSDEPFFPDYHDASRKWFRINAYRGGPRSFHEGIIILLPNYEARIKEINIGLKLMKVNIETEFINEADILGKYYIRGNSKINQGDLFFEKGKGEIDVGFFPDSFHIYIITKKSHEKLDWRVFYSGHEEKPSDIKIEVPSQEIKFLIDHGESPSIEFKRELGKHNEFLESVVSFANGNGGKILLGVDDNSEIIGVHGNDIEGSIQNIISDRCDPIPEVSMDMVDISDKDILLITVYKGKNKPYILLGKGPYIRAGSTDRIVKRSELDELYSEPRQPLY